MMLLLRFFEGQIARDRLVNWQIQYQSPTRATWVSAGCHGSTRERQPTQYLGIKEGFFKEMHFNGVLNNKKRDLVRIE